MHFDMLQEKQAVRGSEGQGYEGGEGVREPFYGARTWAFACTLIT